MSTRDHCRGGHREAPTLAELARFEGKPLPARRLVEIWASMPERERLPFVLSLDERLADMVLMLTAPEHGRG